MLNFAGEIGARSKAMTIRLTVIIDGKQSSKNRTTKFLFIQRQLAILSNDLALPPCTTVAAVEILKTVPLTNRWLDATAIGHSEIVGESIAFFVDGLGRIGDRLPSHFAKPCTE